MRTLVGDEEGWEEARARGAEWVKGDNTKDGLRNVGWVDKQVLELDDQGVMESVQGDERRAEEMWEGIQLVRELLAAMNLEDQERYFKRWEEGGKESPWA